MVKLDRKLFEYTWWGEQGKWQLSFIWWRWVVGCLEGV